MSTAQAELTSSVALYDDKAASRCRDVLTALFGEPEQRTFDVRFWDGTVDRGANPNPPYTLVLNRPAALRRMLLPPNELSIVEAFIAGDVDIDGSMEAASQLGEQIGGRLRSPLAIAKLVQMVLGLPGQAEDDLADTRFPEHARKLGPRHTPVRDAAAIQFHYDVGNDFYKLWLDRAHGLLVRVLRDAGRDLENAQLAKLDLICRKLRLKPGERLLDIGCGWGGLIMHAAEHYGVDATGITLSENQAAFARERIAERGTSGSVPGRDPRLSRRSPRATRFDKISSVGMVEHVGLDTSAGVLRVARIARSSPADCSSITASSASAKARPRSVGERIFRKFWRADAFIDKYVFPDGKLTATHSVIAAAEAAGFEVRDVESLREHYAMTLRHWVRSLEEKTERGDVTRREITHSGCGGSTWRHRQTHLRRPRSTSSRPCSRSPTRAARRTSRSRVTIYTPPAESPKLRCGRLKERNQFRRAAWL